MATPNMMSTSFKLVHLKFTGPVNVEPTTLQELKGQRLSVRILMGPTGSGKSAFIESLSSDGALSISKDSLESVTQEVACYKLVNVMPNEGLTYQGVQTILMDTPGFLDTKMSESKITKMIVSELDALSKSTYYLAPSIYYFHPITDIRMGSSKRSAIRLMRAFAESFNAETIHVVTTMWNTISSPKRTADANARIEALRKDILKRSGSTTVQVHKFHFNKESSLSIMDHRYSAWDHMKRKNGGLNPQFRSLALESLITHISNAQQQLEQLAEDRIYASIPGQENHRLLEVINRHEPAVLAALRSFLDELYELNPKKCSSPLPAETLSLRSSSGPTSASQIPHSPLVSQQRPSPVLVNIGLLAQVAQVVPDDVAPTVLALQASPPPVSLSNSIPVPLHVDILPLPLPLLQVSPLVPADDPPPVVAPQVSSSPVPEPTPPPVPADIALPTMTLQISPSNVAALAPPTTLGTRFKRFTARVRKLFKPKK